MACKGQKGLEVSGESVRLPHFGFFAVKAAQLGAQSDQNFRQSLQKRVVDFGERLRRCQFGRFQHGADSSPSEENQQRNPLFCWTLTANDLINKQKMSWNFKDNLVNYLLGGGNQLLVSENVLLTANYITRRAVGRRGT